MKNFKLSNILGVLSEKTIGLITMGFILIALFFFMLSIVVSIWFIIGMVLSSLMVLGCVTDLFIKNRDKN